MNGVEILAVEQVGVVFKFNWSMCFVTVCIAVLASLVVAILNRLSTGDWFALPGVIATGIIFSVIFGGLAGIYFAKPIEYTDHYQVAVSDDVVMNEFMEKYEIIEQDGKIYTVREK